MTFANFLENQLQDIANRTLDISDATRILQDDIERQIISEGGFLKEHYDFYEGLYEDKNLYKQQYIGQNKDSKQNELKNKINEFFTHIKDKYPKHQEAIAFLNKDLTGKIGATEEVATLLPYLMMQTITYFDQIEKIQDESKKEHFLQRFPMKTSGEYHCLGGFSSRLNPILLALNSSNISLTDAYQTAVFTSILNKEDNVHTQATINALFGIDLKDENYINPARLISEQKLWQAYLDYHTKFQEQFLLYQNILPMT